MNASNTPRPTDREVFYLEGFTRYEQDERKRYVIRLIKRLGLRSGKLLDIGCADGTFTKLIADALESKEVFGIEMSPEACKIASERGINIHQIDLDRVESLPFQDDYFDFVHLGEVIEHLFDTSKLLDEIRRITRPSGIVIITTPNLASWYNRISLLLGYQPFNTSVSLRYYAAGKLFRRTHALTVAGAEHIRMGTLRAWKELFQSHDFEVQSVNGVHVSRNGIPRIVSLVDYFFAMFPQTSSVLIFTLPKKSLP